MTIAMTADWDRFIESLDGGSHDWSNSLDLKALSRLQGAELERATVLLISRMQSGDVRSSRALGTLKDPRVLPALEAHLPVAKGADRIATASSLIRLGSVKHDAAIDAIAEGLGNPELRIAAEALSAAETAGLDIVPALLATAVVHPLDNIRAGAISRALFVTGAKKAVMSNDYRTQIFALANGTPEVRRDTFNELCQIMKFDLTTYRGPRPRV